MDNQLQIPEFTRDEFRTTKPYEYVYSIRDRFQRATVLNAMLEYAKAQKITGVKAMWEDYLKSLKQPDADYIVNNVASFSGAPLELNAGTWTVSESGIERDTPYGAEVACVHPIIPIERYVNVDTGVEKLKIWWRKGKTTRTQIFDKRTLATASSIVALADHGVAVNSESAKALVRWLHDAENLNYELIPEKQSVGRLGWIEGSDDEPWRFSPYAGTLEFDGDENFRSFFGAVSRKGKLSEWLIMCKGVLSYSNVTARILLAASFESVLVKPLGTLPFFVHLWGGTESGKTVSLMLAASVWANPEMGRYIHTFNSTSVGKEMSAAFVNSLPLIMDELQVARSKNGQDEEVYKLAEGVGRTRSNQKLGVSKSSTWSNCILTTGESPLTSNSSGGGAVNRIINIECKDKVFDNARIIANFSRQHYGHAGKIFVERLMQDGFDRANELYGKISRELAKSDITEKQAMAAAIILVGDILATEYLFKDDKALTIDEIQEFLATKATVDVNGRGYQYMCEWVAQNAHKLTKDSIDGKEVWGELKDGIAYIVRSRFSEAAENEGYNSTSLLSYLKQNHLIRCPEKGTSITCRINGIVTKCVGLVLPGVEQLFLDP
jgi:hypothetical protein